MIAQIPLAFEENDGQLAPEFSFLARAQSYSVSIGRDRLKFITVGAAANAAIDVQFAGSRGGSPVPLSGVAYRSNYFLGNDPSQWRQGVPNFSRVGLRSVYPGIDTEFYEKNGQLEHDFIVEPGSDAGLIRLELKSEQPATLTAGGDIVIPADQGELRFRKPAACQFNAEGARVEVPASYQLAGNTLRFHLGAYDHNRTLVIDPVIVFATYVSGAAGSTPAQLATDGSGTLFLTGTTTSVNSFPALAGSATPTHDSGSGSSNVFVAALTTSELGSVLKWITFLGDAGASTASSIAYSANNSGTVYVGGQTTATAFPGAGSANSFGGTFPSGTGTTATGFVTSLNAGTGATPNSTYISSSGPSSTTTDTTSVTGLAADAYGNIYISGYGLGVGLPLTRNSLGGSVIVPAMPGTTNNAFVIELDSALDGAAPLVTYIQSSAAGDYRATAIQVDGSGQIYVAGTVGGEASLQFPSSKSFTTETPFYTSANDFSACPTTAPATRVFLAQIQPGTVTAPSLLGFSLLTCGANAAGDSETAHGLALGANAVYLVGDTTASDLSTGVDYSIPSLSGNSATASFPNGLQPAFAGTSDGYSIEVPLSGSPLVAAAPSAFTYLGAASGSSTILNAAVDSSNGFVQLVGNTSALRTGMPGAATATPLPSGQDSSAMQATGATRGLLYTVSDNLATAESISYFGSTASTSNAASVLSDNAGNAFVLVNDTLSSASGPFSFTSASATQPNAAAAANSYVAEVYGTAASRAATGLTFTKIASSPEVNDVACASSPACEIGYGSASDFSTITFTWNLSATRTADDVVLNFPAQTYLTAPYTITDNGSPMAGCVSQPGLTANGTTCLIPSLANATPHTITLTANASVAAGSAPAGATFQLNESAADAEGEYQPPTQPSVTVANPVTITLNLASNGTTVDAALNGSDTGASGHVTEVTYTATVTNTSVNDSKYTTLSIALPAAFQIVGTASITGVPSSAGCQTNGTGCTAVDVPAGATLTYTFTGIYLGTSLLPADANASGEFIETITANASALPITNVPNPAQKQVTTTVHGYAALTLSIATDKTTPYNLSTAAAPVNVTYTITLKNSGPNASGPIAAAALINTLPSTLPTNFTVSSASISPAGSGVCDPTGIGCTSLTSIPANSSVTYTVVGAFPDNGTSTDFVPQTQPTASATDTVTFTPPTTTYNPNPVAPQPVNITVQRKSDLALNAIVAVTNPSVPCDTASGTSACLYMANNGGVNGVSGTGTNDMAKYTVTVQNNGPNIATTPSLSIPLPAGFLVAAASPVAPNPISITSTTGLTCAPPTTIGQTLTCTGYVPVGSNTVTLISKFADNTVPPPPPGTKLVTTNPAPNSVSMSAAVVNINNVGNSIPPSQLPNVTVERAIHLVTLKYVCSSAGITNPAQPCPAVPGTVNLDEKIANNAPGKNDLVQTQLQIGDTDLNEAYQVTVTDPLPSYFILTQMPDPTVAACKLTLVNGQMASLSSDQYGHPMTGDNSVNTVYLSCALINPILAGTATPGTTTSHGAMVANSAYAQLTYYGKFEDNGLNADIIQTGNNRALAFGAAQASSPLAVLADTVNDATSPITPALNIQRAAHLRIIKTAAQVTTTGDGILPSAGVSGLGIAEAQPGANGGSPVTNPIRYKVTITNDGPNIATHPLLSIVLPPNFNNAATSFIVQGQSLEPALQNFPAAAASCTTGSNCFDGGAINPGAPVAFNIDGYFDIGTLTEGNMGARAFNSSVSDANIVDSNPAGTTAGDAQIPAAPITVVNTPVGSNFRLLPFDGSLNQPLNLSITSTQVAGVTSLVPSGTPALPSGASPNPPDAGATKALYQFASGGAYYTLGTTAAVATANSNPTTVCLNSIPGTFQKPERVLLWALGNAPAGTAFNAVPHYTVNGSAGDITSLVLAQGGGSYTAPSAITSYPPAVQPQPAEVCGVLNGLANATAPTTLAVLEPVNFAPYIRSTVVPASSTSQPGKGVTAAAAQIDLSISPQNNYDYNDQDPCYTGDGTTRSVCNDNLLLTTFLFGGQNFIGSTQQQFSYFSGQIPDPSMLQFNLPAGQPQVYVLVTDQVGAQSYKNISGDPTHPMGCDPGTLSATYTPGQPVCTDSPNLPSGLSNPPAQATLTDNAGAEVALVSGTVGFGGSAGLIALTAPPTEATAHVTAGQTAGFVWNLLTEEPGVQGTGGGAPPTFTLACVSADGTNLAAAGIQCNVSPTYTYSTGGVISAPPAIYVVTTSNTAVGALHDAPLSRDLQVVAAIVFPLGVIPLVVLLRRRKALRLSGWLAVVLFASLVSLSIGCGSSNFKSMGGTTTTATPAGTYQLMVVATGTTSTGAPINIKSPAFAVTVTAVP